MHEWIIQDYPGRPCRISCGAPNSVVLDQFTCTPPNSLIILRKHKNVPFETEITDQYTPLYVQSWRIV